jgi:hypothetical protein
MRNRLNVGHIYIYIYAVVVFAAMHTVYRYAAQEEIGLEEEDGS